MKERNACIECVVVVLTLRITVARRASVSNHACAFPCNEHMQIARSFHTPCESGFLTVICLCLCVL